MPNDYLEKGYTCIYKNIERGCLHCKSQHPCPPLIVIAMRYSREIAKAPRCDQWLRANPPK
jgi:hypothetical protein